MPYFDCFVVGSWMFAIGWFLGAIHVQERDENALNMENTSSGDVSAYTVNTGTEALPSIGQNVEGSVVAGGRGSVGTSGANGVGRTGGSGLQFNLTTAPGGIGGAPHDWLDPAGGKHLLQPMIDLFATLRC